MTKDKNKTKGQLTNKVRRISRQSDKLKASDAESVPDEVFRLFNRAPIGVYVVQDGKFQFTNSKFQEYGGYSQDELLGMDSLSVVLPEDRYMVRENAVKILKGERSSPYEYCYVSKGGRTGWVMEIVSSIQYQGRRAVLGYFIDITERKKMQEQLIITDRLASIGELVSGIAHELNNPLTSIIGLSELLSEKKDVPDNIKEDLRTISTEAQRTVGIVRGLLTFARKHAPTKQPVDIKDIIQAVLALRVYEQKVNNIQTITRFAPDLPEVMADGFQLQQVFLNIIINAEYFMFEAHRRGTLTITTERAGDIIRTSLADDGPGIAEENLGHIFDPFFTTKEVGKGTGLGLSICHGIITAHGGRIYAESELGKRATFVVELPISKQ